MGNSSMGPPVRIELPALNKSEQPITCWSLWSLFFQHIHGFVDNKTTSYISLFDEAS